MLIILAFTDGRRFSSTSYTFLCHYINLWYPVKKKYYLKKKILPVRIVLKHTPHHYLKSGTKKI
jgi:hypothetical protein